jgi:alpha-tubulin suppressor-like RCC1 family protein
VALSSWYFHACALQSDGRAWCWGDDEQSGLGNGTNTADLPPRALTTIDGGVFDGIQQIALGYEHGCALRTSGSVACWGDQYWGETGLVESPTPQGMPDPERAVAGTFQAIAAKGWNGSSGEPWGGLSCAIDVAGKVWCWGTNDDQGLGHLQGSSGDTSFYDTSASRQLVLNPNPVAISGLSGIQQIALHDGGGCALTSSSTVQCWGWNRHGQLADGTETDSAQPVTASLSNGTPISGVKKLYGGHDVVCALQTSGDLLCWGRNDDFALAADVDAGALETPPTLYAQGSLGPIADVAIGQRHICVIRASDGSVWCSGYDAEFELGTGVAEGSDGAPCECVGAPQQVLGPNGAGVLTGAIEISAGWASTCARTTSGLYC